MFNEQESAEQKFGGNQALPNDEEKAEDKSWDESTPKDTWRNYSASGRLAPLLAGVTFCAIFFPFMGTIWGLPVATLAAYSVLVSALAFRDKNCSLHRPQVQEKLPFFAAVHVPILAIVYGIVVEWGSLASHMPDWMTARGRKGSFYDWMLIAALGLLAWRQEHWMRATVKRSLRSEEPE
jgi:hypothetical protein